MKYRLYIDESGDHTYSTTDDEGKRYLGLIGVWFEREGNTYAGFATALEELKRRYFRSDPDEPVILHRKEIMNAEGPFWPLRDSARRQAFDCDLFGLIESHSFSVVGVVIDKLTHRRSYGGRAFHPYHYCLDAMLERYCGYLRHTNQQGDVMAECRGKTFDRDLRRAFQDTYSHGTYQGYLPADEAQRTLTSKEIKLKPKAANIAGLQLAEALAIAVKRDVLFEYAVQAAPTGFDAEICQVLRRNRRYNHQLYTGRIKGYGHVLL